ncbi:MAG: efflux transporter outer membrane subunit [Planctomycetota bacterium]
MFTRILILSFAFTAGCVVGPDPRRPDTVLEPSDQFIYGDGSTEPAELAGWWREFSDPVTEELVLIALENNTDLRAAAASVLEAQGILAQATGARLPVVNLGFDYSRSKGSVNFPTGREAFFTTTFDLGFDVAWQADLFGRLRRQEQSAATLVLAVEADRIAAMHSIVAQVIRARVTVATLSRLVELSEANIEALGRTLTLVEDLYEAGTETSSALDVRLARQNLAAAEAELPPLQQQLTQAELALDVLLGVRPGTGPKLSTLSTLPPLEPPPTGLPAHLLDRRPDLAASQFRAMAEQADIGAEIADLYPDVTLSGSAGLTSSTLNELLSDLSQVYAGFAGLDQLIFDGGVQQGQVTVARAQAERAAAQYAGAVLVALQEVEGALIAERFNRLALAASTRALDEAQAAEDLARDRYERGVETLLNVFEAEGRRRTAEEQVASLEEAVWDSRIDLHLALGGDWGIDVPEPTLNGAADEKPGPRVRPKWHLNRFEHGPYGSVQN